MLPYRMSYKAVAMIAVSPVFATSIVLKLRLRIYVAYIFNNVTAITYSIILYFRDLDDVTD